MYDKEKTLKLTAVGMFVCPVCGKYSGSLPVKEEKGKDLCFCTQCRTDYPREDFRLVEKFVPAVDCENCGLTVTLTEDNETYGNRNKYLCPACLRITAEKEDHVQA